MRYRLSPSSSFSSAVVFILRLEGCRLAGEGLTCFDLSSRWLTYSLGWMSVFSCSRKATDRERVFNLDSQGLGEEEEDQKDDPRVWGWRQPKRRDLFLSLWGEQNESEDAIKTKRGKCRFGKKEKELARESVATTNVLFLSKAWSRKTRHQSVEPRSEPV